MVTGLYLPQSVHGQTVIGDFVAPAPVLVEQVPESAPVTQDGLPSPGPPLVGVPPAPEPDTVLVLSRNDRKVAVYNRKGEKLVSFWVALGKPGFQTPTGSFQVFSVVESPWFENPYDPSDVRPPGPDNPLGVLFIGFIREQGSRVLVGFHGTNRPDLIGQYVSHGCVRMNNRDVLALRSYIRIGTPVYVVSGSLAEEVPRLQFSKGISP